MFNTWGRFFNVALGLQKVFKATNRVKFCRLHVRILQIFGAMQDNEQNIFWTKEVRSVTSAGVFPGQSLNPGGARCSCSPSLQLLADARAKYDQKPIIETADKVNAGVQSEHMTKLRG